jgi:hypothetical protein
MEPWTPGVDEDDHPQWVRNLLAATALLGGAAMGFVLGHGWGGALTGFVVAAPVAILAMLVPALAGAVLVALPLLGCLL